MWWNGFRKLVNLLWPHAAPDQRSPRWVKLNDPDAMDPLTSRGEKLSALRARAHREWEQ
jgi:hypothetical protein